ncbi:hypothetical protein [Natrinema saccharevitans]|uniref:hypothetical protein n=1 Tax=Natrinema saccharevitans TaxID=301967 RepID=UPI001115537E|nr:hypothetical protein [Natrinema saccharevitans]
MDDYPCGGFKLGKRKLIKTTAIGSVATLSGCLSVLSDRKISLYILNWSESQREISVRALQDDRIVFEDSFTLSQNEDVLRKDAIDGGNYTFKVTIDTGTTSDYKFSMSNCEDNRLIVRVRDKELIQFDQTEC